MQDIYGLTKILSIHNNLKLFKELKTNIKLSKFGKFNEKNCTDKKYQYLYYEFNFLSNNCNITGILISYSKDIKSLYGRGKPSMIEVKLLDKNNLKIINNDIGYNLIKYFYSEINLEKEIIRIAQYIKNTNKILIQPKFKSFIPKCSSCNEIIIACYC